MEWIQVLTIAGSTIGACWYMHRDFSKQVKEMGDRFSQETKDFHGRLCTLEERYLQMMQRALEERSKNGLDEGISNRKSKSSDSDVGRNAEKKR